jgi:hypothetical protein
MQRDQTKSRARKLAALLLLSSPRPAPAVVCSTSIDDPALIRWGSDFAAVPLPASANIADCIALCCATAGCQSFSFNVPPQPRSSAPPAPPAPNATCTPDNLVPCCHLKDAVPPLIANPYPTTCQTGVLANYTPRAGCAPPAPPTNASSALANGRIASLDYHLAAGDTWAITSAVDGNMYGVPGDIWHEPGPTFDSSMSVWRIQGVPWTGGLWAQCECRSHECATSQCSRVTVFLPASPSPSPPPPPPQCPRRLGRPYHSSAPLQHVLPLRRRRRRAER